MSHEDEGHYKGKHPMGMELHREAAEGIKEQSTEDRITCTAAHTIAAEVGVSPEKVGQTIDLMEIRITECQLGLFGYNTSERSIIEPMDNVPENVKARILEGAQENKISCLALWQAAEDLGLSKLEISAANEAVGLKICCCQLGAF